MTIQHPDSVKRYRGNGSTAEFPTFFEYNVSGDIDVLVHGETTGVTSTKTDGVHYNMDSPHTAGTAGTVTFVSGQEPEADEIVVILRDVDITQTIDYVENDAFDAANHEDALDKLTMIAQQLAEDVGRISKVPVWSNASPPAVADVRRVDRIVAAKLSDTADGSASHAWDQVTPDSGAATWQILGGGLNDTGEGRARELEGCTDQSSGTVVVMMMIEDSNGDLSARFYAPGACA